MKPFSCEFCNKSYSRKDKLRTHIKMVHEDQNVKQHSCQVCEKSYSRKDKLNNHMKQSHFEVYKKQAEDSLGTNEKMVHEDQNVKQHNCQVCEKSYSRRDKLNSHMKKCHFELYKKEAEEKKAAAVIRQSKKQVEAE